MTKRVFLLAFGLALALAGISQEKPSHPNAMVRGEDGKIYVNKNMGMYVFISPTPEPSDSVMRLNNKQQSDFTNPFYFDTEGINTIRSPWAVDTANKEYIHPQKDVQFNVYADSRSPRTQAFVNKQRIQEGETQLLSPGDKFKLKAKDAVSGVKTIYYSVNGEPYQRYSSPVNFSKETEYTLKYYAVDRVGNDETVHTLTLKVDASTPETSMRKKGNQHKSTFASDGKFYLNAKDNLSGVSKINYRIDSGQWNMYSEPIRLASLNEGDHQITYYARDSSGNTESINSYNFYLDNTPPRIVQEITGDQYYANGKSYSSGRSKIKITAADNKAGVKAIYYKINDRELKRYKEPFLLPANKGDTKITAYATDRVNNSNKGNVRNQDQFKITYRDLTGPKLSYSYNGNTFNKRKTIRISPQTKISFSIKDNEAGPQKITYTLDDQKEEQYKEPLHIKEAGEHKLKVTGYDNVNNTTIKRLRFVVDKHGPEIFKNFSVGASPKNLNSQDTLTYPVSAKLYLSATDAQTGVKDFFYKITNASQKPIFSPVVAFNQPGIYNLELTARDYLGNQTKEKISLQIRR